MLFSVSIFALIAVFFESKYFCASSTPLDGSEAASTRLINSSVNESNSVSNVLISASFLQPVISRQARAIDTARTLVRIRGSLHKVGFEALSSNRRRQAKSREQLTDNVPRICNSLSLW